MGKATQIKLSQEERKVLSSWSKAGEKEHRLVERARIILLAAEEKQTQEIAKASDDPSVGRISMAELFVTRCQSPPSTEMI